MTYSSERVKIIFVEKRMHLEGVAQMKKATLLKQLEIMTGKPREELIPSLTAIHIHLNGVSGNGGQIGQANIPYEYSDFFLFNSPARQVNEAIYKQLETYVSTMPRAYKKDLSREDKYMKNLYLWSEEKGNGKTSTAAALLNEFMMVGYKASLAYGEAMVKPPSYFFDVNEFQTLYNTFNRAGIAPERAIKASEAYYNMMEFAKRAPYTVFDDIGVRSATEAFRADLHSIINHRTANQLASIYTSNVPISQLDSLFDERLADRVRQHCLQIKFEGSSQRGVH